MSWWNIHRWCRRLTFFVDAVSTVIPGAVFGSQLLANLDAFDDDMVTRFSKQRMANL